jgi:hypothetical protein
MRGERGNACCAFAANGWSPECASVRDCRMRRVHLRGHTNILEQLLIHVGAFKPGLLMRQLYGIGTPTRLRQYAYQCQLTR